MAEPTLRRGDFWRICDRSGFKVPASKTRKEWNGLIVDATKFEKRHPQDFVKGRREKLGVPDPRPRPVTIEVGALRTTIAVAAAAGALTIELESTVRFDDGDKIGIMLATGDQFTVIVQNVNSSTQLLLTQPLPYGADVGAMVVNYTAVAEPDYG